MPAVAFSPDGSLLASAGQDQTVRLWSVPRKRLWATLVGHAAEVTAVAWHPAGGVLYTGGVDKTVIPWTVRPADAVDHICRDLVAGFPGTRAGGCVAAA